MNDVPTVAKTWEQLAGFLDISKRQLDYDRAKPGAPVGKNIAEWKAWRAPRRAGQIPEGRVGDNPVTLAESKLREEIRALRLGNDSKEDRLQKAARRAAEEVNDELVARIQTALLGTFPARAAEMVTGKTTDQAEAIIRGEVEKVLGALR